MIIKVFAFLIFASTFSFAQITPGTEHEFELSLSQISFQKYKQQKSSSDSIIYGGYNRAHKKKKKLQYGFEGGFLAVPDGLDTKTVLAALAIGTYTFSETLSDGPFLQIGAGVYPAYQKKDNEYDSVFSYFGGAGYKFDFMNRITYKPYLRVWQRDNEAIRLDLRLLNFSLFF